MPIFLDLRVFDDISGNTEKLLSILNLIIMLTSWIVWLVVTVAGAILFAILEYHSFDAIAALMVWSLCIFETMMGGSLIPSSAKHQGLMLIGFMVLSLVVFFVVYLLFALWLENRDLKK